jgi:hypothetical protein
MPVEIDQCIGTWYELEDADRCYLSEDSERNQLGIGSFIGDEVWDAQARFRIRVGPLGLERFKEYFPDGTTMGKFVGLTRYLAGQAAVFEVQVFLRADEVPYFRLDDEGFPSEGNGLHPPVESDSVRLGWMGWLKTSTFVTDAGDAVSPGAEMPYTQTDRRIAISTPLGKDALLLRGFSGVEAISQLFHFDLDLLSENDSIKFQDVVGKNVTLRILDSRRSRTSLEWCHQPVFSGLAGSAAHAYRAQMVPWLWFLTRTADCRIFQNKDVPT